MSYSTTDNVNQPTEAQIAESKRAEDEVLMAAELRRRNLANISKQDVKRIKKTYLNSQPDPVLNAPPDPIPTAPPEPVLNAPPDSKNARDFINAGINAGTNARVRAPKAKQGYVPVPNAPEAPPGYVPIPVTVSMPMPMPSPVPVPVSAPMPMSSPVPTSTPISAPIQVVKNTVKPIPVIDPKLESIIAKARAPPINPISKIVPFSESPIAQKLSNIQKRASLQAQAQTQAQEKASPISRNAKFALGNTQTNMPGTGTGTGTGKSTGTASSKSRIDLRGNAGIPLSNQRIASSSASSASASSASVSAPAPAPPIKMRPRISPTQPRKPQEEINITGFDPQVFRDNYANIINRYIDERDRLSPEQRYLFDLFMKDYNPATIRGEDPNMIDNYITWTNKSAQKLRPVSVRNGFYDKVNSYIRSGVLNEPPIYVHVPMPVPVPVPIRGHVPIKRPVRRPVVNDRINIEVINQRDFNATFFRYNFALFMQIYAGDITNIQISINAKNISPQAKTVMFRDTTQIFNDFSKITPQTDDDILTIIEYADREHMARRLVIIKNYFYELYSRYKQRIEYSLLLDILHILPDIIETEPKEEVLIQSFDDYIDISDLDIETIDLPGKDIGLSISEEAEILLPEDYDLFIKYALLINSKITHNIINDINAYIQQGIMTREHYTKFLITRKSNKSLSATLKKMLINLQKDKVQMAQVLNTYPDNGYTEEDLYFFYINLSRVRYFFILYNDDYDYYKTFLNKKYESIKDFYKIWAKVRDQELRILLKKILIYIEFKNPDLPGLQISKYIDNGVDDIITDLDYTSWNIHREKIDAIIRYNPAPGAVNNIYLYLSYAARNSYEELTRDIVIGIINKNKFAKFCKDITPKFKKVLKKILNYVAVTVDLPGQYDLGINEAGLTEADRDDFFTYRKEIGVEIKADPEFQKPINRQYYNLVHDNLIMADGNMYNSEYNRLIRINNNVVRKLRQILDRVKFHELSKITTDLPMEFSLISAIYGLILREQDEPEFYEFRKDIYAHIIANPRYKEALKLNSRFGWYKSIISDYISEKDQDKSHAKFLELLKKDSSLLILLKIILEDSKKYKPVEIILQTTDFQLQDTVIPDVYDIGLSLDYIDYFWDYRKPLLDALRKDGAFMGQYNDDRNERFRRGFIELINSASKELFRPKYVIFIRVINLPTSHYFRITLDKVRYIEITKQIVDLPFSEELTPSLIGHILRREDEEDFYKYRNEISAIIRGNEEHEGLLALKPMWISKFIPQFLKPKLKLIIDDFIKETNEDRRHAKFALLLNQDTKLLALLKIILESVKQPERYDLIETDLVIGFNGLPDVYDIGLTFADINYFYQYRKEIWAELNKNDRFIDQLNLPVNKFFKKMCEDIFISETIKEHAKFQLYKNFINALSLANSRYLHGMIDRLRYIEITKQIVDLPFSEELTPSLIGHILRREDEEDFYNYRNEINAVIRGIEEHEGLLALKTKWISKLISKIFQKNLTLIIDDFINEKHALRRHEKFTILLNQDTKLLALLKIILESVKQPEQYDLIETDFVIGFNGLPDVYDVGLTNHYIDYFWDYRKPLWVKLEKDNNFMTQYNEDKNKRFRIDFSNLINIINLEEFRYYYAIFITKITLSTSHYLRIKLDQVIFHELSKQVIDLPISAEIMPSMLGLILRAEDEHAFYYWRDEIKQYINKSRNRFKLKLEKISFKSSLYKDLNDNKDFSNKFKDMLDNCDTDELIRLKIALEEVKSRGKQIKDKKPGFFERREIARIKAESEGVSKNTLPIESSLTLDIRNYEDNIYDLLLLLQNILTARLRLPGIDTTNIRNINPVQSYNEIASLGRISTLIKRLPSESITDDINVNALREVAIKLSNAPYQVGTIIINNLISSIRKGIKERTRNLGQIFRRLQLSLIAASFSPDRDYQFQLYHTDIDADINKLPKGVTIESITERYTRTNPNITFDITKYIGNDDLYYINFRQFFINPNFANNAFDIRLPSGSPIGNLSYRIDYIMGVIKNKGQVTYFPPESDYLDKIKIKLNKPEKSRLFIILNGRAVCKPENYALLCDLIEGIPSERINIIYDYEEYIVNGQLIKNIELKCNGRGQGQMLCKNGIAYNRDEVYLKDEIYTKRLFKMHATLENMDIMNAEVSDLLDYITYITRYTKGKNLYHIITEGRKEFEANNGKLKYNNVDRKRYNDFINNATGAMGATGAIGDIKFRITSPESYVIHKYNRKKAQSLNTGNTLLPNNMWKAILTSIYDIIELYNKINNIGNIDTRIRLDMRPNPFISELRQYIKDFSDDVCE